MATYRKLPSGKWQARVYHPSGKRPSKSDWLKSVVREWAIEQENKIHRGEFLDPKSGKITMAGYFPIYCDGHLGVDSTARKHTSHWKTHVEPAWGTYPLDEMKRSELKTWVKKMTREQCKVCLGTPKLTSAGMLPKHDGRSGKDCAGSGQPPGLGAWTILGAVSLVSAMLSAAVEERLIPANPALRLDLPRAHPKAPFYWTRDAVSRILMQLSGPEALMVDLDMHVGLRPGELFGLRKQVIDLDNWLIWVVGVMTRSGWRAYPKSKMSFRPVPVPDHLRLPLANHLQPLRDNAIVFTAPGGGPWDDRNFARRVFEPAIEATAIIDDDGTVLQAGVRRGTPYGMRHTAASLLVQDGVDLYRVQQLFGHEDYATTQRYAHLQPTAFDPLQSAWAKHVIDPRNIVLPAHLSEPRDW